jgi:hypothetical protein
MSADSNNPESTVGPPGLSGPSGERRRRRRHPWLIATAVVVVGAGVAVALSDPFSSGGPSRPGATGSPDPTSLYTVTRMDLSSQTRVSATLGYSGSYSVVNQAQGTVTSLPSVGQVVTQGQVLYQMSGSPVVLLSGSIPAYRTLSSGLTGEDVAELNADLVALGYATSTEIPSGTHDFTHWTEAGVEKLQAAVGVTQSGTLSLGQAVFEPTAVRVTTISASLGAAVQPSQPVLAATSTTRQVSINLDAAQQSEVATGDKVTITLPNNRTTPGVIFSVGAVAAAPAPGSSDSSPTITVLVQPIDAAGTGTWDQAPVNVTITTGIVTHALVVPDDALLAQADGSYALEVVGAHGVHRLVAVTLGLSDDANGLLQVSGSGLAVGQRVVVPKL